MRTLLNHTALLVAGILAMALGPSAARAQKALVYCPTGESAGCETIVNALSSTAAFSAGVDKGFDGSAGTVDLKTVDLFQYSVVFVPSLSDDADGSPYALLRTRPWPSGSSWRCSGAARSTRARPTWARRAARRRTS
jgi:hypothetical protein